MNAIDKIKAADKNKPEEFCRPHDVKGTVVQPTDPGYKAALTCSKHAIDGYKEMRHDIFKNFSRVERMATGLACLQKAMTIIQLCQRVVLKDGKHSQEDLEEIYFLASDLATSWKLYRDCEVISQKRFAFVGKYFGAIASEIHKAIPTFKKF